MAMMSPNLMARIAARITQRIVAAAILILCVSGCREYDVVQEHKFSEDGQFWTDRGTQFTGALDHDIKGVTIGKTRPTWID
jgi:hypothetical protein